MKTICVYLLYYRTGNLSSEELAGSQECERFLKLNQTDNALRFLDYSYYPLKIGKRPRRKNLSNTHILGLCKDQEQAQEMIELYKKQSEIKKWSSKGYSVHAWQVEVDEFTNIEKLTFYVLWHMYEESWYEKKRECYLDYLTLFAPVLSEEEAERIKESMGKEYPYSECSDEANWSIRKYSFDKEDFAFLRASFD